MRFLRNDVRLTALGCACPACLAFRPIGQKLCSCRSSSRSSKARAMKIRSAVRLLIFLAAGLNGCATVAVRDPGQRVLDAVVVEREYEPASGARIDSGSFGSWNERMGSWYLVFEARDGEATVRYRLAVNQQQYMQFQQGTDVQITLVGYELRFLRRRS